MNSAAASIEALVYSGKLPAGSPCGFWMPMTMGSPSAFSGVSAAHWRSAVNWPAFLPSTASMESSGSQAGLTPPSPPPPEAVVAAPPAAVVVAPPAAVVAAAAVVVAPLLLWWPRRSRVVVVAARRGEQGERSDHDEWLQHARSLPHDVSPLVVGERGWPCQPRPAPDIAPATPPGILGTQPAAISNSLITMGRDGAGPCGPAPCR